MENKRVYTEATDLLREIHRLYTGSKLGNPETAHWFDNCDGEYNSGTFYANAGSSGYCYKSLEYTLLPEQKFIEFMEFPKELIQQAHMNESQRVYEELQKQEEIQDPLNVDNVNSPSHYTDGKIEVIDFIEDKNLGFHLGNAVKYVARAGKKDSSKTVEDLNKAIWYIKRHIGLLEND